MEPDLPPGATSVAWIERDGVRAGLCDIQGQCWLHSLESTNPNAYFTGIFGELEDAARTAGYSSILAESTHSRLIETALKLGWTTKVMEKKL